MKAYEAAVSVATGLTVGTGVCQAQLTAPDLTGIATNLNTVVASSVTGINFSLGSAIVIGGILTGLAVLGAVVRRVRAGTPR
jgi:hypothetical protein